MNQPSAVLDWATRQRSAAQLGAERRRLFLTTTLLSLLVPVLPYLSGTWETAWYTLARTDWPFAVRTLLFLLAFYLVVAVILAPLSYYGSFILGHRFGLSRQTSMAWASDWLKGLLLASVLGTLMASAFLWVVGTTGGNWWWIYGIIVSAALLLMVFLVPYVLLPLFFKVRPLADASVVARVQALVARAGTSVREVDSLDFSRRGVEANAAVIGLGRSRRVVIADTLLAEFTPDEVDAVVAHELGHQVHGDMPRLLAANLAILWIGLGLSALLAEPALPVLSLPSLGYVPGFPEVYALVELYLLLTAPLVNGWSRQLESAADVFALRLTANPSAFAGAMRRLASQNLVEVSPPAWAQLLFGSHPSLSTRIARAEAWAA